MGPTRAAAAPVETHEVAAGTELLLRTTSACNQRCGFCFLPERRRHETLDALLKALSSLARRPGRPTELTISGGEPTSDPRLTRILTAARRRGFKRFLLETNAVLLDDARLAELTRLGVDAYVISLHSHVPERYDEITGSRGLFPRAAAGLARVIADRRLRVTVNVVVNKRNVDHLDGLVGFLASLGAGAPRQGVLDLYFSMINEAGHQLAAGWTVPLETAAPALRLALARCAKEGIAPAPFVGGSAFPPCAAGGDAAVAPRGPAPQDRVRYADDFSGEAGCVGRAKRPSCRACALDARCLGVPASYAKLFGVSSLEPLPSPS